jgi:hypothetical protein
MAGGHDAFWAAAYSALESNTTVPSKMSQFNYYDGSWGILSILASTGNFWNFAP